MFLYTCQSLPKVSDVTELVKCTQIPFAYYAEYTVNKYLALYILFVYTIPAYLKEKVIPQGMWSRAASRERLTGKTTVH